MHTVGKESLCTPLTHTHTHASWLVTWMAGEPYKKPEVWGPYGSMDGGTTMPGRPTTTQ